MDAQEMVISDTFNQARLELLYQPLIRSFVVAGLAWLALTYIFWGLVNNQVLLALSCLYLLQLLLRLWATGKYYWWQPAVSAQTWIRWHTYAMLANGGLWGCYTAYLALNANPTQLSILLMSIAFLASGSATSHSLLKRPYLLFCVSLTLPFTAVLLTSELEAYRITGAIALLWSFYMYGVGTRFHQFSTDNLMLQQEKLRLIDRLEAEKEKAEHRAVKYQQLSNTDALTGLFNRGAFEDRLNDAWVSSDANTGSLSLLLCDVDDFKAYNDAYGHYGGDQCLRQVSDCFQKTLPAGCFVARYGGEELAVLMKGKSQQEALQLAETLRTAVYDLNIPHRQSALQRVTVSIGVASLVPLTDEQLPHDLIECADRQLYLAKASGKNCVK